MVLFTSGFAGLWLTFQIFATLDATVLQQELRMLSLAVLGVIGLVQGVVLGTLVSFF